MIALIAFIVLALDGIVLLEAMWKTGSKSLTMIFSLLGGTAAYYITVNAYATVFNQLYTTNMYYSDSDPTGLKLLCPKCTKAVPLNSHHCGICNLCLLDHNHHCLFLGVCIARGNRSAFRRLVLWCMVGLLLILIGSYFSRPFRCLSLVRTGKILASCLIPLLGFLYAFMMTV